MEVKEVVSFLIGTLIIFYVLAAFINPLETGVRSFEGGLNGSISGEVLGTATGSGALDVNSSKRILATGPYILYNASGTPHTSWDNVSLNITHGNRYTTFTMDGNGTPNSTANSKITIDYYRADTQADELSGLPKVAYLIALISVLVGIIYLVGGRI